MKKTINSIILLIEINCPTNNRVSFFSQPESNPWSNSFMPFENMGNKITSRVIDVIAGTEKSFLLLCSLIYLDGHCLC
jgi:hypothetical protein